MNFWLPFDYINKLIDLVLAFLGFKKIDTAATHQQNQGGANTIINAKTVKIYHFDRAEVERKISEQEEEIEDLTNILESEIENTNILPKQ